MRVPETPPDLSLPLDCHTRAGFSSDEPAEKAPPRSNGGDYPVIVWNIRLCAGITFRRTNFEREVNHEARSDRYR